MHQKPCEESYFWRNHKGAYVLAGHYGGNKAARLAARELGKALKIHVSVVWVYRRVKISDRARRVVFS